MHIHLRSLFILQSTFLLLGCSSGPRPNAPLPPPENGGIYRQTNQGYSLLYKLMDDESDVGKIFILKSADDAVANPIKQIGDACGAARKQMDQWPKQDNRIEFDVPDLPYYEQRSRDLESKDDEHDLLHSSGKDFELNLVFTQVQAMGYAVHLCAALQEKEQDAGRKAFLENLGKQCAGFRDQLTRFLVIKP